MPLGPTAEEIHIRIKSRAATKIVFANDTGKF